MIDKKVGKGSEKVAEIIPLRQAGVSWQKIGQRLKIDPRTAKKAYEDWENSRPFEELKEVRKTLAAEDFREHRDFIITLAGYLVSNLSLPNSPVKTNSEQFFSTLLQENILGFWHDRLGNYPRLSLKDSKERDMKRRKLNVQENQQILNSLLVHTKELRCPEALDKWKAARNQCIKLLPELREKCSDVIKKLRSQPHFRLDILNGGEEKQARWVEAVLQAIWLGILEDNLEECPLVEAFFVEQKGFTALMVKGRQFDDFNEESQAKKAAELCNQTVINLCKAKEAHIVHDLHAQVSIMKESSKQLEEMLYPLKLKPIILRTRCDLCPA